MARLTRKVLRRSRSLRREMTNAEVILWMRLRDRGLHGQKFRRQHPIGPYMADFACVGIRLVVELDGATHATAEERAYDTRRDAYLRCAGWKTIRFTNEDVYKRLDDVLDTIVRVAGEVSRNEALTGSLRSPPLPCASRMGEGS